MSKNKPMMTCGCAANATTEVNGNHVPCCVIHDCTEVVDKKPSLKGRKAKCSYGSHGIVPSNWDLAFFSYRPDEEYDEYYCGCYGWD